MGQHEVDRHVDPERLRAFGREVLKDLRALQQMERSGLFESGVRRIGAEQEMFLVDASGCPAPLAMEVLEAADEPNLTTELGKFNLEVNLEPELFEGECLTALQNQLDHRLDKIRQAAQRSHGEVVLVGILPSLTPRHLTLDWMAPIPRYYALNDAFRRLRDGRPFRFRILGRDELIGKHDNVMFEACNTSFQVHLQVSVDEFSDLYNLAQLLAGPTLATATNSPLLFGRQLWRETRIAVFEQSVDTRAASHLRTQAGRVSFGSGWVQSSVAEIFEEDLSRFRSILAIDVAEDSLQVLAEGGIPKLKALSLFNGTVYRWNRPCYGITQGKPHLRIENRVLPSGPTTADEVANAAFWLGCMIGLADEFAGISQRFDFSRVRDNFRACALRGLGAQVEWPEMGEIPVPQLVLEQLLPGARRGLEQRQVDPADIDRYLDIIEERVRTRRTGSQWQVDALEALTPKLGRGAVFGALVQGIVNRQWDGRPVHEWESVRVEKESTAPSHARVEDVMTTDLFTVNEEEVVDMAAAMMKWRHIRRIPVEDSSGKLVGLVTYRGLLRLMSRGDNRRDDAVPVSSIMETTVITARPETPTLEAAHLMRKHRIGCLPVTDDGDALVGIVTENDLMRIAWPLLEEHLNRPEV